ncbi:MAG: class I SAM-dependent methyltransferase [Blastocatellia bacterium]
MQVEDFAYLYELEEQFWWFAGMRDVTAALLDPVITPAANQRALDAGCGTGANLAWLRRYTNNVIGLDIEPAALDFCRLGNHTNLMRASATHVPCLDKSLDIVTSFDVLVQIPGQDSGEMALREIYRVLRPGGICFVRVAAYEWMRSGHDAALATQRRYTLPELKTGMTAAGFEIVRATYANTILLPVAVLRRLALKRLGLADAGSDVKPLPRGLQPVNRLLINALRLEARFLARNHARLPFGLSAICVGRKPESISRGGTRG